MTSVNAIFPLSPTSLLPELTFCLYCKGLISARFLTPAVEWGETLRGYLQGGQMLWPTQAMPSTSKHLPNSIERRTAGKPGPPCTIPSH